MKTFLKLIFCVILLLGVATLGGCERKKMSPSEQYFTALEQTLHDINPQYITELQWMRSRGRISYEYYQQNLQTISERKASFDNPFHNAYFVGSDTLIPRETIQYEMQDKTRSKWVWRQDIMLGVVGY